MIDESGVGKEWNAQPEIEQNLTILVRSGAETTHILPYPAYLISRS